MPKVNIQKKSTDTDMTPFVDIAFLILSFFIMATKMKAPETVPTTPPNSVSAKKLPENEAVLITMDKENRVYFTVLSEDDPTVAEELIEDISKTRNLNLTATQKANFKNTYMIGTPFSQLGSYLSLPADQRASIKQPGIPVTDSLTNELVSWIASARGAFADGTRKMKILIKGDNEANYVTFESVIDALRRNEELKYNLVTSLEQAPAGTDLANSRAAGKTKD